jgi:lycopene cyclase domain-containing protein
VQQFGYLAMLAFVLLASGWIEFVFKANLRKRIRRVALAILPVALVFIIWDWFATLAGHWSFDYEQTLGIIGPFGLPLEEYLFFLVIPLAALWTLEGVRYVLANWEAFSSWLKTKFGRTDANSTGGTK